MAPCCSFLLFAELLQGWQGCWHCDQQLIVVLSSIPMPALHPSQMHVMLPFALTGGHSVSLLYAALCKLQNQQSWPMPLQGVASR